MKASAFFSKRFFPLFWVQFLGAFNDNLFKNALVMLITFRLADTAEEAGLLITLAAGLFILPFFLFSAFAGQLADKYEKTTLIRKIKLSEILIMLLGATALVAQDMMFLFAVLFLMGVQSAFFGPIKYAILPEHLEDHELLDGNGWFSASTFVAILLGTIVGGWVVLTDDGETGMAIGVLIIALLGYVASRFVPTSASGDATLPLQWNILTNTYQELELRKDFPQAFFAVLSISWFWFLGATYLSQMPVLVSDYLSGNDKVVLLFLAVFSIGIALGAWIASQLKTPVRTIKNVQWLVLLLVGISLMILLGNGLLSQVNKTNQLMGVMAFLQHWDYVIILLSMLAISTLGGWFIVPLYTLLQVQTQQHFRSRMVAVNNITNAIFMVLSAVFIMVLYAFELSLITILYGVSLLNLAVAYWYLRRSRVIRERT
ncbi:MAG: MFS transporter [Hydrogenovibrio crunogenus]|uniref:Major facilitator superfamily (MFS) transporter protein n=1 Tax=Hydrogenovibrio crunogenus (strain DSM 25203 / XCL-2) TaxID=317025 RepID=Q31JK7_HYDCU|nr:MFS transporter [Hydrogenovibrio crunogenus]